MELIELEQALDSLIMKDNNRPVVVFSALWPLMTVLNSPRQEIPEKVLQVLMSLVGKDRDLLMPTFTNGYQEGVCDLDKVTSTTGVLSETFRQSLGVKRSLSAFFSFGIKGPHEEEFCSLQPKDAWGEGSCYHWMEEQDALFLMMGTHPTNCSYVHRMEWLARAKINYRYPKKFSGTLIRNGVSHLMDETLYVRALDPSPVNDFTVLQDSFLAHGMKILSLEGVSIAAMTAQAMKQAYLPLLEQDPLITVENRDLFELITN